ncbi:ankyrin-2 [Cladorrhinum sp. PSN332]|nr:ankyrin-2 [Cladorrhinum sp. PSN332]
MDFDAKPTNDVDMDMDIDLVGSDEDIAIIDRDDVSTYNEDNILPEDPHLVAKMREWFQPTSYDLVNGEYQRHLASHSEGTGAWLCNTPEYDKWHRGSDHGLLWIKGIPGSGKSVYAATLAHQLAKEGHPVLYFFFRQIIDANHQPVQLVRDWLHQIIPFSPPLQQKLKRAYVDPSGFISRSLEDLGIETLWDHLQTALAHMSKVYLVADALDEMDKGNEEFLKKLAKLGSWKPANVKLLITSRPVNTIELPLRQARMPVIEMRLEECLVDQDIATFVQRGLDTSSISPHGQTLIKEAVPGRANGLFLYAKLAMDAFLEPGADVQQVLEELPFDLNSMYADLLHEHRRRSGVPDNIQILILSWVTHAARPLRLLELAEVISVTYARDVKSSKELVRSACGPLLEVLPDETVSVIHHSFTEFLVGSTRTANPGSFPIFQAEPTHQRLALACLNYLQSGCLETPVPDDYSERAPWFIARKLEFPFLAYAAEYWPTHVCKATKTDLMASSLLSAVDKLLTPGIVFDAWRHFAPSQRWASGGPLLPLHFAASYGLASYIRLVIDRSNVELDALDRHKQTALFYAARNGHASAVEVLIEGGANPDRENRDGLKPLHVAASHNHGSVITALLSAGVDPMTIKTREDYRNGCCRSYPMTTVGNTAVMYACRDDHLEAVEAFLPFLKTTKVLQCALNWASESRGTKVLERLLEHPDIDVNAKVRGDTALFIACRESNVDAIEALVNAGADASILNQDACDHRDDSISPLEVFCARGGYHIGAENERRAFHLLVQAGADIHRRGPSLKTPLHLVANRPTLLRALLEAGVDPNAEDEGGSTLLHQPGCPEDIIRLLLQTGKAEINKRRASDGKTPLLACFEQSGGHLASRGMWLIDECGADCSIADRNGNTVLHFAAKQSSPYTHEEMKREQDMFSKLVSAGAPINSPNKFGKTPIHLLPARGWSTLAGGNLGMVKHLVALGADIEAQDHNGETLLMCWFDEQDQEGLNELIALGSKVETRDHRGRTLLHRAVALQVRHAAPRDDSKCAIDWASLNLAIGLGLPMDPNVVDYSGNTLLHEFVARGSRERYGEDLPMGVFKDLVRIYGVNPDARNYAGQTVLHLLCASSSFLKEQLKLCKDIDAADNEGIRPIHLAASVSEYQVSALMAAGADIYAATHDGLTPLHLAAKARQSNIVALLLAGIATGKYGGPAHQRQAINAVDSLYRSPLYYACMSGRPETVDLLLRAGARVRHNLLDACAMFEVEDRLWTDTVDVYRSDVNPPGLSAKLHDKTRPQFRADSALHSPHKPLHKHKTEYLRSEHDTTRLDEVIQMLMSHGGADILGDLQAAVNDASGLKLDYTRALFEQWRVRLAEEIPTSEEKLPSADPYWSRWSSLRAGSGAQALLDRDAIARLGQNGSEQFRLFQLLLFRREYDVISDMFSKGLDPCAAAGGSRKGPTALHLLVEFGYLDLLSKIATKEHVKLLHSEEWAMSHTKKDGCWSKVSSLVVRACRRTLPNLRVLSFLVESLEASVDAPNIVVSRKSKDQEWTREVGSSPLHAVVIGNSWWQAHEALPYLIRQRPNMSPRCEHRGETPLHVALRGSSHFKAHIVQLMVEAGADVNAVDNSGTSCLALALEHMPTESIELLLSKGARADSSALFAAVDAGRVDILELLLSHGLDVNALRVSRQTTPSRSKRWEKESSILYHVASCTKASERTKTLRILLARGGDPFVKFRQHPSYNLESRRTCRSRTGAEQPRMDCSSDEREEYTVLHEVIRTRGVIAPFLELPDSRLDLEHRDSLGHTVLHVACGHRSAFDMTVRLVTDSSDQKRQHLVDILVKRGADVAAIDPEGRTALHILFDSQPSMKDFSFGSAPVWFSSIESLKVLLTAMRDKDPTLINKREAILGRTPLLCALQAILHSDVDGKVFSPWSDGKEKKDEKLKRMHGAMDKITLLLDGSFGGADPTIPDNQGNTALHYLAVGLDWNVCCKALFPKLVGMGMDVNARNSAGETPVFWWIKGPENNMLKDSYPAKFDNTTREEEEMAWKLFEDSGADLTAVDNKGRGLLHFAAADMRRARDGSVDGGRYIDGRDEEESVVQKPGVRRFQRLVEKGLDATAVDYNMRSCLDVAAACENSDLLVLFEKKQGQ